MYFFEDDSFSFFLPGQAELSLWIVHCSRQWPDSFCVFVTEVSNFWVILHTGTVYRQWLFVSTREEFDVFCVLFKA